MDRGANLSDIGLSFSTGRLLYFAAAFFFAAQYAFMLAACFLRWAGVKVRFFLAGAGLAAFGGAAAFVDP
jgi:hypothetical protein